MKQRGFTTRVVFFCQILLSLSWTPDFIFMLSFAGTWNSILYLNCSYRSTYGYSVLAGIKKTPIVLATKLNSSGSPQAQLLYDSINEREGEINLTFRKIELFIVVCRSPMSSVWWVDGGENRAVHLVRSGECIGSDHGLCGVQDTK